MILQEEENKSEKKKFWQRFRSKKQDKIPSEAVSIRSLVNEILYTIFLIKFFLCISFDMLLLLNYLVLFWELLLLQLLVYAFHYLW